MVRKQYSVLDNHQLEIKDKSTLRIIEFLPYFLMSKPSVAVDAVFEGNLVFSLLNFFVLS